MISPSLAFQLKEAGLEWHPAKRDNFMLPASELANEIFTLNDQTILVEMIKGSSTVTFHGSAEWALDDILLADVLWLPSESQLRQAIEQRLAGDGANLTLTWNTVEYRCMLSHVGQQYHFAAAAAEDAYGHALLFLLQRQQLVSGGRWVNSA